MHMVGWLGGLCEYLRRVYAAPVGWFLVRDLRFENSTEERLYVDSEGLLLK